MYLFLDNEKCWGEPKKNNNGCASMIIDASTALEKQTEICTIRPSLGKELDYRMTVYINFLLIQVDKCNIPNYQHMDRHILYIIIELLYKCIGIDKLYL